jgi:hypothetical protein
VTGMSRPGESVDPEGRCPAWCEVEARWGQHTFDEFAWQDQAATGIPAGATLPADLPPGSLIRLHGNQLTIGPERATVNLVQYEVKGVTRTFVTEAKIKLEASAELTPAQARTIADALLRGADLLDSTP